MTVTSDQVAQILRIAESAVPGLTALPGVSEATAIVASLLTRLVNGETLDQLQAEPLKLASTIDVDKLRKDLADAAG